MDERSTGIVLRTRPLTESSLIVHWLTAELGRVATVAKGARRPKSPLRGKVDLFYSAEFTFARSRRSDLHTLREVSLQKTRAALRRDLDYLNQGAYCARLIEQTTECETPLPEIYKLFESLLDALPLSLPKPQTIFAFEAKLLAELGLSPREGKLVEQIESLAAMEWPEVLQLQLGDVETRELRQFLHGFLIYHLGKIPSNRGDAVGS